MLNWCNRFNICCFLDNHNYHLAHHSVECLIAAGTLESVSCEVPDAFQQLRQFSNQNNDWLFGHLAYDLKNEIEDLSSSNEDHFNYPDAYFFVPRYVIQLGENTLSIGSTANDHHRVWEEICNEKTSTAGELYLSDIQTRYSKVEYMAIVERLKQHILRGDCYEINFCQEFFAEHARLDPIHLYASLSESSPNPFSAFYKLNQLFLSCMSPERYLKKAGDTILSQPIKGTSRRDVLNPDRDRLNADDLLHSEKERAENIMVVDLVRNDLSKICREGTVKVDELCAVYSFPHVHQMISTISGKLLDNIDWTDAVKATFPMGSMTGAPKKKVMELIEKYEITRRGLFSGSIGYVTPEKDFDFNVVIRSVLYNQQEQYLSFHTGSAITFNSDPENEYEECLLKAAAIKKALAETNTFH